MTPSPHQPAFLPAIANLVSQSSDNEPLRISPKQTYRQIASSRSYTDTASCQKTQQQHRVEPILDAPIPICAHFRRPTSPRDKTSIHSQPKMASEEKTAPSEVTATSAADPTSSVTSPAATAPSKDSSETPTPATTTTTETPASDPPKAAAAETSATAKKTEESGEPAAAATASSSTPAAKPKVKKVAGKNYSTDPALYIYTSLTAGNMHIVTATSRLETILRANRVPFKATDLATDEKARMLWGRRAGKTAEGKPRRLPALVQMGLVLGVSSCL